MNGELSLVPTQPLIVVAEDDSAMRVLVASCLRSDGYDVLEAADGAELLFIIHAAKALGGSVAARPALVVSDIRMPYASGTEVLGRLRTEWLDVPFVFLSAFVDEPTRLAAKALGAAAVLAKPFDLKKLRALVAALVPLVSA